MKDSKQLNEQIIYMRITSLIIEMQPHLERNLADAK